MCGIAGFCRFSPNGPESESILRHMNRALAHRGPDAEGVYRRDGIGLAHRRLSVIDLEGGAQPFVSDDGMTAIVLNGEIYNHLELREELLREGRRFRSRSDTEVVLQLYESAGEGSIQRLRGMFAFAIWDQRKRRLWLARDRLGLKPLYYYWNGDLFVFGSELKALLEHPEAPRVETGTRFENRVLGGDSFAASYLDIGAVRRLWSDHRSGIRARTQLLWSILVLETWGRRFQ